VREPGSFFTCVAGATPIVVVRGRDGELRAFVNVCRHRGHEVAQGCGRRETLQCPYHAWTYDLDGSLRAAPRSEREPGFDHSDWSLRPALVDTWGPLVFVNVDLDAAPLAETLGELPHEMAERRLHPSTLTYRGRSRDWVVDANWKLVVENFLECYHCPVAHKSFSRLIDVDPDAYQLTTGRWYSSQYGPAQEGKGLPYDPAGEIRASQFHFVWPNWTLNILPGPAHIRVLVFQPLDADRTASFVDGFWAPGTPDEIVREITDFGAVVGAEDRQLVESVHRGLRSGAIEHGRLLLNSEHLIQHFQLLVHDAVTDGG
jgi:choline monooxygenase